MDLFNQPDVAPKPRSIAPANVELEIRDDVLRAMIERHGGLLAWLEARVRKLYTYREDQIGNAAYVTADDARIILESEPGIPGPDVLNRNFMGSLFKRRGWRCRDYRIKSRTPGSHANELRCWFYVGESDQAEEAA